jgi:hypothetical protein
MAAPQPNALKPINTGNTVDAKLDPKDLVKLKTEELVQAFTVT